MNLTHPYLSLYFTRSPFGSNPNTDCHQKVPTYTRTLQEAHTERDVCSRLLPSFRKWNLYPIQYHADYSKKSTGWASERGVHRKGTGQGEQSNRTEKIPGTINSKGVFGGHRLWSENQTNPVSWGYRLGSCHRLSVDQRWKNITLCIFSKGAPY